MSNEVEFTIRKKEHVNRNIRFEKELFERANLAATEEGVSFNALVNLSLEFALKHRKPE